MTHNDNGDPDNDRGSSDDNRDEHGIADPPIDDPDAALGDMPLSIDAMLDILANPHRRYMIEYLREQPDETAAFEDVTKYIIARVGQLQGRQPNHDDVQVNIQHHHIPKMSDAGILEFDVRSQTIRYRPNEPIEELYDRVKEFQDKYGQ